MNYGEASHCELNGVSGIPRTVWLCTTLHYQDGKFSSFALDTVDQDTHSQNPSPKYERGFRATGFEKDIHELCFSSDPGLFAALNEKITPQLNKCLISARDLMSQHWGLDRLKEDTGLRECLEREVVKRIPISTAEMKQIAQRSVRRGRIDFPNILDASLPYTLIGEVRAILRRTLIV